MREIELVECDLDAPVLLGAKSGRIDPRFEVSGTRQRPWPTLRSVTSFSFAIICLLAAGCGGSAANKKDAANVEQHVVHLAVTPSEQAYDTDDPRLQKALKKLETLFGRPIDIRFNLEMMPNDWGFFIESILDSELGVIPRVLEEMQEYHEQDFLPMFSGLQAIEIDYDGSLTEAEGEYNEADGILRFVLNYANIERDLILGTLYKYYHEWLGERYLTIKPSRLKKKEYAGYYKAIRLTGAHFFASDVAELPENQQEATPGRSIAISRLVALRFLVGNWEDKNAPELDDKITEQLLKDGRYLKDVYKYREEWLADLAPSSPWLRAEKDWMKWALDRLANGDAETRLKLLELLQVPPVDGPYMMPHKRAFPGFDLASYGLPFLEKWALAGYPTAALDSRKERDPTVQFYDWLVCGVMFEENSRSARRGRDCEGYFYASALADSKSRQRLINLAATTNDMVLKTTIVLNIVERLGRGGFDSAYPVQAIIELWKRLEKDPAGWRWLTHLMAVEEGVSTELAEALYDEASRYYRSRPQDRGMLLFLFARIGRHLDVSVAWKTFEDTYGSAIGPKALAGYLDADYLAFETLEKLTDALEPSWAPGAVVARHLHKYLEDPLALANRRRQEKYVRYLGYRIREIEDLKGLKTLAKTLEKYIGTNPTRERHYREALISLRKDAERLEKDLSR